MTLLLDPKAREAVIHGPPRILMEGAAQTVMANIARRVAEAPDGLIRSFQTDGSVRQETFAELWRRSGEIATQLRTLGVGPGSQAVLLLRDLLDFVPSCWASLRVGAIPIPLTGVVHGATKEELEILASRLERPALIADSGAPDLDRLARLLPDAPILRLSALSNESDQDLDPVHVEDREPSVPIRLRALVHAVCLQQPAGRSEPRRRRPRRPGVGDRDQRRHPAPAPTWRSSTSATRSSTGEPPRQLVGFQRVSLAPGQSTRSGSRSPRGTRGGGTTEPTAGARPRACTASTSATRPRWRTCRCATRSR